MGIGKPLHVSLVWLVWKPCLLYIFAFIGVIRHFVPSFHVLREARTIQELRSHQGGVLECNKDRKYVLRNQGKA